MKKIKYFIYRILWKNANLLPIGKMPIHLDLELTNHCNLSCIMCPHSEKEKQIKIGNMPLNLAKSILKAGKNKIKSVKFNWRGEPSLYKNLPDIISYAKECGYIETMINTNFNCSSELLKEIVYSGIDKIIISIDSFDENVFSKIRRGGNLSIVLNNLKLLKEIIQNSKFKPEIIIQARKQKLNENEIFKKEILLKPAMQRTSNGEYVLDNKKSFGRKNCLMPIRRLLISWEGKIFGCCSDWYEKNCLGKIKTDEEINLSKFWNSIAINKLRHDLNTGAAFEYEPCKSCFSMESYIWKKLV